MSLIFEKKKSVGRGWNQVSARKGGGEVAPGEGSRASAGRTPRGKERKGEETPCSALTSPRGGGGAGRQRGCRLQLQQPAPPAPPRFPGRLEREHGWQLAARPRETGKFPARAPRCRAATRRSPWTGHTPTLAGTSAARAG